MGTTAPIATAATKQHAVVFVPQSSKGLINVGSVIYVAMGEHGARTTTLARICAIPPILFYRANSIHLPLTLKPV